ncbi:RNA polymerase subunit sigma-70 [Leptospira perolatii]|uniref:RNA polymerase subunit sigma-70 n=1 Tax=Leptospira perolatii TaxID=2023191 RepID=A0A2M9ZJE5_9LEPT|nr:sigma-70 family RNA polymerase sigma factor [Leptospira perolatii]PJZ68178.1 RNA polymerase subunit sigma-70 [Leptospira perolatii]PJZ72073.1 RNA polymerase subunit sigma-70 [Leptospira perolatii]
MASKKEIWDQLASKMKKAQAGDAKEYQLLLHQCAEILRAFLRTRIGSQEDREDLLQEILLGIHKARDSFRPDRPFAPWLFSIARYKTIDYLRKRKYQDRIVSVEVDTISQPAKTEEEPWMVMDGLQTWLSVLDERQREVLTLAKLQGYSTREISEQTGLSESNVKVIVHRSIQKIRKAFWGEDGTRTGVKTSKR